MDDPQVLEYIWQQKIITIDQLTDLLKCSMITARRRLKTWKAHTSINQNGRYYTLPTIPVFDGDGLWRYQAVLFSKHGNLKQTIAALIQGSRKGLSTAEITRRVDLTPNSSIVSQLKNAPGIKREKQGGCFVYWSDQPDIREKLKERREKIAFPTDAQAVVILVQLIKHPSIDIFELSAHAASQGISIEPSAIQRLLQFHGLLKKSPGTRS